MADEAHSVADAAPDAAPDSAPPPPAEPAAEPEPMDTREDDEDDPKERLVAHRLSELELRSLQEAMFDKTGERLVADADALRWHQQAFVFSAHVPCCLVQSQGGPCGVLAAVQAEMLRLLLFPPEELQSQEAAAARPVLSLPTVSLRRRQRLLVAALTEVLVRATSGTACPTVALVSCVGDMNPATTPAEKFVVQYFALEPQAQEPEPVEGDVSSMAAGGANGRARAATSDALLAVVEHCVTRWQEPGGVLLFVYSLILSRGIQQILDDMDAPSPLTAQFGFCNQEMVNLLLLGRASSNVFDGDKDLGGMVVKGVLSRPNIGYLTQLEVERLVQVEELYKSPRVPVWVVGSSSHFTVLFGTSRECLAESASDTFCRRVRKAFRARDPDGRGFLDPMALPSLLADVGMADRLSQPEVEALQNALSQGGVMLWADLWVHVSRLWAGFDLQDVLTTPPREGGPDANSGAAGFSTGNPSVDHDARVAQALQDSYNQAAAGAASAGVSSGGDANAAGGGSGAGDDMDDPDLALAIAMSLGGGEGGEGEQNQQQAGSGGVNTEGASGSAAQDVQQQQQQQQQDPTVKHSLKLFHYNGLEAGPRTALLSEVLVDTSSAADTVGCLVPLDPNPPLATGLALTDIILTLWPSASVFYPAGHAPSID